MKYDPEKEEAYQAWTHSKISDPRFEPFGGMGPLMKDNKTGMVYDVTEFQMRFFEENGDLQLGLAP